MARVRRLCAIRPLHGDRVGRKVTLVASLLTMGSPRLCGLLPGCATIGIFRAALLLALARFGQGTGAGRRMGQRGVISDGECAAAQTRAVWLASAVGRHDRLLFANGTFLLLSRLLTDEQFMSWGWRVPFYLLSAVLLIIGLYIARVAA